MKYNEWKYENSKYAPIYRLIEWKGYSWLYHNTDKGGTMIRFRLLDKNWNRKIIYCKREDIEDEISLLLPSISQEEAKKELSKINLTRRG